MVAAVCQSDWCGCWLRIRNDDCMLVGRTFHSKDRERERKMREGEWHAENESLLIGGAYGCHD